jgi:hypothetical protein
VNFGRPRQKQAGVDTATNIPPTLTLNPHNELSYNPIRPSRIGLYCLLPSKAGGESIIARNSDITDLIPPQLIQHLNDHGGILYERSYRDANAPTTTNANGTTALDKQLSITWQEKCGGVQTRQEAEDFWISRGFYKDHLIWEPDGSLRVQNIETALIQDPHTQQHLWFNNIDTVGVCADGSGRPPQHLLQQYQAERWKAVYAWRLQPGDWLVLDNFKVQHGRLPYPEGQERRLLTVLTA